MLVTGDLGNPGGDPALDDLRDELGLAVGALADRLTERLGAPDGVDARAATADAVERLIADGVLERVDSSPL